MFGFLIISELFSENELILLPSDLSGPHRQLFVVIYDHVHPNRFLACAKIRNVRPRIVKYVLDKTFFIL